MTSFKEALHNPREDALVRIGIGHKALFAAKSLAIGKKSNAVDCPSPGPRRPQGVMQRFLKPRCPRYAQRVRDGAGRKGIAG